jgi:pimeloyl-ACP methyl ester carboxylesterase
MQQSNAVLTHDVERLLDRIAAPTQITFGRHDQLTSLRFADPLTSRVRDAELLVFEGCSPLYEKVAEFNERTLQFLRRHAIATVA